MSKSSIVPYKTGTQQTINLVLDTIRPAMKKEKKRVAAELQLHSDQGFQYISREHFNLTQSHGITPSISRRGNCYDNAINAYIHFYNYERIQLKTGVAPLTLRHST